MAYDQMLAERQRGGQHAHPRPPSTALVAQTRGVEAVVAKLGLKIEVEGSESLDDPTKVKTE